MIEVMTNLFVGNQDDYERRVKRESGWAVVHACKEPYHRKALGYTGRAALKTHPEYLVARRGDRLILNLIDTDSPKYIPKEIIDAAIEFIDDKIAHQKVLVHCNQGQSRSPSIAMLYMAISKRLPSSFADAENAFRNLYRDYSPASGIRGFLKTSWDAYVEE